jgi:hypothetical protein
MTQGASAHEVIGSTQGESQFGVRDGADQHVRPTSELWAKHSPIFRPYLRVLAEF